MTTEYFFSIGHTRIGHITGTPFFAERRKGCKGALESRRIPVEPRRMAGGDFSVKSGFQGAKRLLAEYLTAIFAGNGEMAPGVSKTAAAAGLRIPENFSPAALIPILVFLAVFQEQIAGGMIPGFLQK